MNGRIRIGTAITAGAAMLALAGSAVATRVSSRGACRRSSPQQRWPGATRSTSSTTSASTARRRWQGRSRPR